MIDISNNGVGAGDLYNNALRGIKARAKETYKMCEPSRQLISQRARVVYMFSPECKSAIDRIVQGVVGQGLTCSDAAITSDLNEHIRDITGENTIIETCKQIIRQVILDGEAFIYIQNGYYKLLESQQIKTPAYFPRTASGYYYNPDTQNLVYGGVEIDSTFGRVLGYWHKSPFHNEETVSAYTFLNASEVSHIYEPEFANQYRGISKISNVIESLYQLACYMQAETQAAIVGSCYSLAITTPTKDDFMALTGARPEIVSDGEADTGLNSITQIQTGGIYHLRDGEKIESLQNNHVSSSFATFREQIIKQLAMCLGIPRTILEMDFDGTYSSSKAGSVMANNTYKPYLKLLQNGFLSKIYGPGIQWTSSFMRSFEPIDEYSFYKTALDDGFITKDEMALALFGHEAVAEKPAALPLEE